MSREGADKVGWLTSAAKAADGKKRLIATLKSVREKSVVSPGLESILPFYPALKRWAKLGRPSGAAFSCAWFHQTVRKGVLTHTLKRCATPKPSAQPSGEASFARLDSRTTPGPSNQPVGGRR